MFKRSSLMLLLIPPVVICTPEAATSSSKPAKPAAKPEAAVKSNPKTGLAELPSEMQQMRSWYLQGDGVSYTRLSRKHLNNARYLSEADLVEHLEQLLNVGKKGGFDGLSSLVLMYMDCTPDLTDSSLVERKKIVVSRMKSALNYRIPTRNMPVRFTKCKNYAEYGVYQPAVKALLKAGLNADKASTSSIDDVLRSRAANQALCELTPRINPLNRLTSRQDLERQAQGGLER